MGHGLPRADACISCGIPRRRASRQPGVSDPLRCPDRTGDANNPDCDTQSRPSTFGGNPDLQPEKSNQTTIGGVWEPVTGVSIGLDWFYLTLKDLVTNGVPIATILDPAICDQYSYLVTRGPVQPAFPTAARGRSPRSTSLRSTSDR